MFLDMKTAKHIKALWTMMVLLCSLSSLMAQENGYQVTGRVFASETGQAMAGVRITSPDVQAAAMTDAEGRYEIILPSLEVLLVAEAPDYTKQVVPLKGRREVDFSMTEVFGKGFYDAQWNAASSEVLVSDLSHDAISFPDNLAHLLSGQVRSQKSSGAPGAGAVMFVRGLNSLHLSAQPLYVVDGVLWQMGEDSHSIVDGFYNNPLHLIDPADIERVRLVKDASALWGSKASGGVIYIDTKRGRDMATRIEARFGLGLQMPFDAIPMMDAEAYRLYATDVMKGMKADQVDKLQFTDDDPTKFYYHDTHNQTQWLNEVNKPSLMQNYGISVSGGDEIALYRFSLGYAKHAGNIVGSAFDRLNVRFNSDIHLTKKLDLAADIAYSQTSTQAIFDGLDVVRSPYYMALTKSPLYAPYQRNGQGMVTNRLNDADELGVGNPLVLLGDNVPSLDKYRFNMNIAPTYRFSQRLSMNALFGFTWDKANEGLFIPDAGVADSRLCNALGEVYAIAQNEVRDMMARRSVLSADAHLDWQALADWRHHLDLSAGGRFYALNYGYTAGQGFNTGSDYMTALSNTNSNLRFLTGFDGADREAAWYMNADYAYLQRYFIAWNASVNASSRYGAEAGNQAFGTTWAPFMSLSAAWLMSSEKFMQALEAVNYLKLRVAYDHLGNDRLPFYANRTYSTTAAFAQDAYGQVLAGIANPNLKWETTTRVTLGMDMSLFNNRLSLNADFYNGTTDNLLTQRTLPEVAGLPYYWDNCGAMANQGYEIAVDARLIDLPDWKLSVSAMAGHYENTITSLPNGSFLSDVCGGQILTQEGSAAALFYGHRALGVFSTAAEAEAANLSVRKENGELIPFAAGDIHFKDIDNNHIIDDKDREILGDPNPELYGNFQMNLRYKRWTLGALFTYSIGNEAYNALRASLESGSAMLNQSTALENRWMADGQQTSVPRATYGDPLGNARFSNRWIEDASYLKMKHLSLSYQVPLKTNFIQQLNIWASAGNLFCLSRYLGADPEFSYGNQVLWQGVDAGMTPHSRQYQLGVRINL